MLKKISSIQLLGILVALGLVYFAMRYFGGHTRSNALDVNLANIDTAKVSKIQIEGKGKSLELTKEGGEWKVGLGQGKFVPAEKRSVQSTINTLLRIKPSRLAARDKSKWKEYQVDSTGTRIQIFEGNDNTMDLVIGKFGVQNQRSYYTYVRPYNNNNVYAIDNFMGISFGTDPKDYRNKQLLSLTTDSIAQIKFDYPADSAFSLVRNDSVWEINNSRTDSASTVKYLNNIRYVNNSDFVDDIAPAALGNPVLTVTIDEKSKGTVTIKAYQNPIHHWIINSSLNPESYFSDNDTFEKIFISKKKLLNPPD